MTYGGLVVVYEDSDLARDLRQLLETGRFSDYLSIRGWQPKEKDVCLLSFDGRTISHAALATRSKQRVSVRYRVDFSEFVSLDELGFAQVIEYFPEKETEEMLPLIRPPGGRLTPSQWERMIDAVIDLRPHSVGFLQHLERLRLSSDEKLDGQRAEILAEERDSIGLAMDILDESGDLRKRELGRVAISEQSQAPFLANLTSARRTEEQILAHDAFTFPDGRRIGSTIGATFEVAGRTLDVSYFNHTRIENTVGVDLIYLNRDFDAYTLIQYKRLTRRTGSLADPRWAYRPNSDGSFPQEIERMKKFRATHLDGDSGQWKEYRLDADGFFFKFCKSDGPASISNDLIPGLYLPRDYLERLLNSTATDGIRTGKIISPETMQRHLNNTAFTELVRDGWIGTRGLSSRAVEDLIRLSLESKHAVVLAAGGTNV